MKSWHRKAPPHKCPHQKPVPTNLHDSSFSFPTELKTTRQLRGRQVRHCAGRCEVHFSWYCLPTLTAYSSSEHSLFQSSREGIITQPHVGVDIWLGHRKNLNPLRPWGLRMQAEPTRVLSQVLWIRAGEGSSIPCVSQLCEPRQSHFAQVSLY